MADGEFINQLMDDSAAFGRSLLYDEQLPDLGQGHIGANAPLYRL